MCLYHKDDDVFAFPADEETFIHRPDEGAWPPPGSQQTIVLVIIKVDFGSAALPRGTPITFIFFIHTVEQQQQRK